MKRKLSQKQLAKMRVAVAEDVIEQIKVGRFHAKVGYGYVGDVRRQSADGDEWFDDSSCLVTTREAAETGIQFQRLTKKIKTCTVCAKGGLFISAVDLHNNLTVSKITKGQMDFGPVRHLSDPSEHIEWLFEQDQFDDIESAFEGGITGDNWDEERVSEGCFDFTLLTASRLVETADDRLIAICKNIIANNGTFDAKKFYRRCNDRLLRLKRKKA